MLRLIKQFFLALILAITLGHQGASFVPAARADTFSPEIKIPGTDFADSQTIDNDLFGKYVRAIYIYFIWVVGIIATFMIVYAGVKWVAAAGDQARIRDAREMINNAIIGVIIGLTSVVLLNILSPGFTTLSIPGTTSVTKQYFDGAAVTRVCNPDHDGELAQLQCGNLRKIGEKVDRNGKPQDEYCLGTLCDSAAVCGISYNASTQLYARGSGCIARIPSEPNADPLFQSVDHVWVSPTKDDCSVLHKTNTTYFAGNRCGNRTNDLSGCYLVGTKATIVGSVEPYIAVKNMRCPQ